MVFLCYLSLKQVNIHINSIRFDDNFDHPHINSPILPQNDSFYAEKVLDTCLLQGLSCPNVLVKIAMPF